VSPRPLVFYVGTVPFFSLLYITGHLAGLQFNGLPSAPYPGSRGSYPKGNRPAYNADYTVSTTFFILCVSVIHTLAWLLQSILCTSCELAPILSGNQGRVPKWCPQSRFRDSGQPNLAMMLGTLAPVKDFLQWGMVALSIALIECARREYMRAEYFRRQQVQAMGAGVDFGGPSQGTDILFNTKSAGVELKQISGPKLVFRAEEEARRRQEEAEQKRKEAERKKKLQVQFAPDGRDALPLPVGPGAPGNKDNYYGNGMGLQRSNTLNYMYESRVGGAGGAGGNGAARAGNGPPPSAPGAMYESRVAGADAPSTEPTAPQPARAPSKRLPTAPPPPGKSDNYYGNAMGLKRSGTLNNNAYESRI
jgi:hypothetical protein